MVLVYGEPVERWSCDFKACSARCCKPGREATIGDVRRIREKTGLRPEEFLRELSPEQGLFHIRGEAGRCVFLQPDLTCQLHEKGVKPIFCQMYPFKFDGIIYADELVLKVRAIDDCPNIGLGDELTDEFEVNIETLANRFLREIEECMRLRASGLSTAQMLEAERG